MDLIDLQASLTGILYQPCQQTASKCINELLSIGLEYTMLRAEKAGRTVQIPHLEGYLSGLTKAVSEFYLTLNGLNKDFKKVLQKMSDDIDVSQGHTSYVDGGGYPLLDEPNFSDDFVSLWVKARVPELVGINSKTLETIDVLSGLDRVKNRLSPLQLMALFLEWSALASNNLNELKTTRAKQGQKTLNARPNHDAWLVQSVASVALDVGGTRADVLEIAQTIARWADPSRKISYQWGKAALSRIKK